MTLRHTMSVLALAVLPLAGCGDDDDILGPSLDGTETMVLRLSGTAVGVTLPLVTPSPGGETEGLCFDVDLVDVGTGTTVGSATDCLNDIEAVGDGLALVGTTIFDFGDGHTFTTRGLTTVQPTTHGSPDVTHTTGAIPTDGENGVIDATGRFTGLEAEARLSGAVNLSRLESEGMITFDCVFIVEPL